MSEIREEIPFTIADAPKELVKAKPPRKGGSKKIKPDEYDRRLSEWFTIRRNALTNDIYCNDQRVDDFHESVIGLKFYQEYLPNQLDKTVLKWAVLAHALKHTFDPVRDYFNQLPVWDGTDRVEMICDLFKSKDDLFRVWFRRWVAGVPAKVYLKWQNPMLVLSSIQDLGKSHFSEWLSPSPDVYRSVPIQPQDKDCRLALASTLIWEVGELGATTRKQDVDRLKHFMTLQDVRDRKAYGHFETFKPSIASFIGTINGGESGFLYDPTGNRRFMVAEIEAIDWSYTALSRDQLWAQAMEMMRQGEHKLSAEEKKLRDITNETYTVSDPVEDLLSTCLSLSPASFVSLSAILERLKLKGIQPCKSTTMKVAQAIQSLYPTAKKARPMIEGVRRRGYEGLELIPE